MAMTFTELQETYTLLGKLGSGSGGIIILAEHKRLHKKVVLKKISNPSSDEAVNRKEAEILKKIHHETLPAVYDYLEIDHDIYTVMDYIEGESLETKAQNGASFSLEQLRTWGKDVAEALSQLHSQNPRILHLDVKPANIMIRPSGRAVLIDFNVSLDGRTAARMGYTEYFCSPEQKQMIEFARTHRTMPDLGRLSEESDIYSLGAVLYFLASGKNYTPENRQWDQIARRYTPEFAAVLKKALAQNPQERYHSAQAMKADLAGMEEASQKMKDWEKKIQIRNVICYAGLCICIVLFGYSFFLMNLEKQDRYDLLVEQMKQERTDGNFQEMDPLYNEARDLEPDQPGAYYEKAAALYDTGKYQETIDFIQGNILNDSKLGSLNEGLENTYYLLADSYYQMKQYKDSADIYDRLFEMEELQPVFYRDYAITLGYNKQFDKAADILEKAAARGLDSASLTYANAEIAWAREEPEKALALMNQALDELEDESVRMHAFEKIAEWNLELKNYGAAREILLTAREDLPKAMHPIILETLVQTDSRLADQKNDNQYRQEAIGAIQEMIDNGWAVYSDYNNMAVFYQKMGQIDQAEKAVDQMSEKYGEDYNAFKRKAFLEIDRQLALPEDSRNYSRFTELYDKALQLYSREKEQSDLEMPLLESLNTDLQQGGWI